jgi:hypothetical protein
MVDDREARLARYARSRHGVFTRAVARELGWTEKQIRHRLATGQWRAMSGEALMIAGAPETFQARVVAGVSSVPGAAAGFEAAARMQGMPGVDWAEPVIVVPRGSNHRVAGVTVRESNDLLGRDVRRRWGIDVTTPERTVCDLGRVLGDGALLTVVDDQLRRHQATLDRMYGVFYRYARRGRPGVTRLRRVLERFEPGFVVPESVLERRTLELLRAAEIPLPDGQVPLTFWDDLVGRVDFAYVEERIVIEVDGRRFHGPEVFESDRERDNAAGLAGWRVLRFTWAMVTERPEYVVAVVTAALAQARRRAA